MRAGIRGFRSHLLRECCTANKNTQYRCKHSRAYKHTVQHEAGLKAIPLPHFRPCSATEKHAPAGGLGGLDGSGDDDEGEPQGSEDGVEQPAGAQQVKRLRHLRACVINVRQAQRVCQPTVPGLDAVDGPPPQRAGLCSSMETGNRPLQRLCFPRRGDGEVLVFEVADGVEAADCVHVGTLGSSSVGTRGKAAVHLHRILTNDQ